MIYISHYKSPIGNILLACKDNKLIGLWIEQQKYYALNLEEQKEEKDVEILIKTKDWLDRYFKGENPSISELDLDPIGSEFRKKVWKKLCEIPYGEVTTYKDIAKKLAEEENKKISNRAVGGSISHNPILIIIPCHRVIGTNGSLTGYAAGIDKKVFLLKHENIDIENLFNVKEKL